MISPMQWYLTPEAEVGCRVQGPVGLHSKTASKKMGGKILCPPSLLLKLFLLWTVQVVSYLSYVYIRFFRLMTCQIDIKSLFMYYEEWVTYEQLGTNTDCIAGYIDQAASQWVTKIACVVCSTENVRPQSRHQVVRATPQHTTGTPWRRGEKTLWLENTLGSWVATGLGKT